MESFFIAAYEFLKKRKLAFFLVCGLVFGLLGYWASRITFEEDIAKLLPASEETQQLSKILEAVSFTDKTVITIYAEQETAEQNASNLEPLEFETNTVLLQSYADELIEGLRADAGHFIGKVQGQADEEQILELIDLVDSNLPVFLEKPDYKVLDSLTSPTVLQDRVQQLYQSVSSPSLVSGASNLREDPLGLIGIGLKKFQKLQANEQFVLVDGYIMSPDQQALFIFITPESAATETDQNQKFIEVLDREIAKLDQKPENQNSSIKATYFGATAMAVANAKQIKKDIQITLSIAFLLLFCLFLYFYRQIHIPIVVIIPALFGSLLGVVALYLLKGTISAVSIGIGSVLLGLTLDYSLHILSHYRNTGDIRNLFKSTTRPLIMCAVFTAVDFMCLIFLRSDVLKDLGIFAAVSIMGAAIFSLLFIPQVYTPTKKLDTRERTFIDKLAQYDYESSKFLKILCVLLIFISLFTYSKVGFDNSLDRLNYQPTHLKLAEERLERLNGLNESKRSVYLIAHAENAADALLANEKLYSKLEEMAKEDSTLRINSIASIASSKKTQQDRIQTWNDYWSPEKINQVKSVLQAEGAKYGFRANTYDRFFDRLTQRYTVLDFQNSPVLHDLFMAEYVGSNAELTTIMTTVQVNSGAEKELIMEFSDNSQVIPIDRRTLQSQFLSNLEADFDKLLVITSIAMFVVLFLFFKSVEMTLITNIPVFLGWLVTLGLMGLLNIQFNAFNMIITTLIFGLGIDYSIFITKGMLERYTFGKADLPAYKAGILMSAITTVLCFGILVFAKHPAIQSIAIIPLFGLLVVVLMAFTVQAWLFDFYLIRSQQIGNTPRQLIDIIKTIYTFGYFFVGGFLLSVVGRFILWLVPVQKENKIYLFHKSMQLFFKGLVLGTPFTRVNIIGQNKKNFESPVVVISNHTSQLDTPTVGMLHDKFIFVVNDRVLNSKFFGNAIKMAGFYSSEHSTDEKSRAQLRQKISQGYSVIVFPEGTRSRTAEIGRFHKGAFLLAEQLGLPILPVLVHGNTDVLPKNDNVLKRGDITIQFLEKIEPNDLSWGNDYSQRSKSISKHFKASFRSLRDDVETVDYFKRKLFNNYTYKSPEIKNTIVLEFQENKQVYHKLMRKLPLRGNFLQLGCGYGILSYLLAYDSSPRKLYLTDQDDEKINVLKNTFSVNRYPIHCYTEEEAKSAQLLNAVEFEVIIISSDKQADLMNWSDCRAGTWLVLENGLSIKNISDFELIFKEKNTTLYKKL